MTKIRIGVQVQPQHALYPAFAETVRRVEAMGVDTIWNWDHFYPLYGDPDGLHYEAWTLLTAMATLTHRVEIGCLVTCNTYRNPQLLADMARTVDHISGGRLILGIGAGWFEKDYQQYGYEFGTFGTRIQALESALPIILKRFSLLNPPPTRKIPILIGASGEKKMLRLVAQYADIWNVIVSPEDFKHKNKVLNEWCEKVGRNPAEIERSVVVEDSLDLLDEYLEAGATHILVGTGGPYDLSSVERLVRWREGIKS